MTSHGAHDLTVHLLAAVPNRSYLEAHGFGLDRFLAEPLRIEDGLAVAPDRPGHGDRAGLEGPRRRPRDLMGVVTAAMAPAGLPGGRARFA